MKAQFKSAPGETQGRQHKNHEKQEDECLAHHSMVLARAGPVPDALVGVVHEVGQQGGHRPQDESRQEVCHKRILK